MASSNQRQRQLARAKAERQAARRSKETQKQDRTKVIATVLIIAMVALTTGGYVITRIVSAVTN